MVHPDNLKIENPVWWKRRTRLERCSLSLLIICLIIIAAIIILFALHLLKTRPAEKCQQGQYEVCLTPNCVKTASQILEKVNLNVDPCDDFYEFACGNYVKNTRIPEDQTRMSPWVDVGNIIGGQLRSIAEKPIESTDTKPVVLAKSYYQACMNTSEIEKHSVDTLKGLIARTGGWPLLLGANWNETEFDWLNTTYEFMKYGLSDALSFSLRISVDPNNSSRNILMLDQMDDLFHEFKKNGFNDSVVQSYYNYAVSVAIAFGAPKEQALLDVKDAIDLDILMNKIIIPPEELRDSTQLNNRFTIRELETEFPFLPWLEYINAYLRTYKTVDYDEVVVVRVPKFFRDLQHVIRNTPKRVMANYMYWNIVENHIKYLNEELRVLELDFYKTVFGISSRPPRWRECVNKVAELYVASGALYVRNFFDKGAKRTLVSMVDYIKSQFLHDLKAVDWMDETTKKQAVEKAQAMKFRLAYPDELLDDDKVNEYYTNLTFDASDYLQSSLNLSLFAYNIQVPELDKGVDKSNWQNHAYVVLSQAFYDRSENSIELLAGILLDVFFDTNRPKFINFGAIGHVIGHEITHGFDDKGRQYDKNGHLVDWWKPKTKEEFDKKAQCMIEQYGNFTVPEVDMKLNGINTQGENIADNGGIKTAYLAYKKWVSDHGPEPVLPGLPYSPEQMFWVSVANIWCEVARPEHVKLTVLNDNHPPNHHRVNLALMNSDYFAKDFSCSRNSFMNPEHKCKVW